jgi:hypothetical protein
MGREVTLICDWCGYRTAEEDRRHLRSLEFEGEPSILLCDTCSDRFRTFSQEQPARRKRAKKGRR